MMYWGYGSDWGAILMVVSMVAFWALVIGGIVLVVRVVDRGSTPAGRTLSRPQEILDERLARGEIDEADYSGRSAALRAGGARAK